jgi:hypothetical protein
MRESHQYLSVGIVAEIDDLVTVSDNIGRVAKKS